MEIVLLLVAVVVVAKPDLLSGIFGHTGPAAGAPSNAPQPTAPPTTLNDQGGPNLNPIGTGAGTKTPGEGAPAQTPGGMDWGGLVGKGLDSIMAAIGGSESPTGQKGPAPSNINPDGTGGSYWGSSPGEFDSMFPGTQNSGYQAGVGGYQGGQNYDGTEDDYWNSYGDEDWNTGDTGTSRQATSPTIEWEDSWDGTSGGAADSDDFGWV